MARRARPITPCYEVADGRYGPWMALDIDVSVFDNSDTQKQGVSWTYKKVGGFAPIFAYLGQEVYLLNGQLREGQPAFPGRDPGLYSRHAAAGAHGQRS